MNEIKNILALDIGEQRIGIARANSIARIPVPLKTLKNDQNFNNNLQDIINELNISELVVGLPRGLDGNATSQTKYVNEFMKGLKVNTKIIFQDEALTTVKAEEFLKKFIKNYSKADIDKIAAMFILEDYLRESS